MLYYNVYNNITDEEFIDIRNKMTALEQKMSVMLNPLGWKLTMPVRDNEGLIVDFTIDEKEFWGNIGFEYVDEPGQPVFTFYVTKTYYLRTDRFFVKKLLYKNKKLAFYDQDLMKIIKDALKLYHLWDAEYLRKHNML
ncbi:hypothetical protein R1T15_23095 [Mucilaginibacter sp. L3T2-6]|nr:hypothetical protein [Mucilaginibacter sp. L3T2-6]